MPRMHTISETIEDTVPRLVFVKALKEAGYIPKDWEYMSLHLTQKSPADDVSMLVTLQYAAPKEELSHA